MGSRAGARIVAFTALVATGGALAAIVLRPPAERPAAAQTGVGGLTGPMQKVAEEIERLEEGRSARRAQRAVRRALRTAREIAASQPPEATDRAVNALERTQEYLDALGSVLSNPRSTLRTELPDRAQRARAALAAARGGAPAASAVRGWERVLERAERRRRR